MSSNTGPSSLDVEDLLSKLELNEKIALLSGSDFWHTTSVPRLNIPSIRLSDGPNGVRGTKFFNGVPAACLPCGTALAATWDIDLIRKGGVLQGDEAIAKGASVLLGPTVNMQRSPLGGRGFESFSEDPALAGAMAAATIQGIQSKGVAATIKHYVCNDQEHERMSCDSVVSERALREIYLMPFQIAQRDAKPWSYMTAYNQVNGLHASENPILLQKILRDEWRFDGLVMSDWFGTYSTTEAIKAGLDLEMPGPSLIRGRLVQMALACAKLAPRDIDNRVREVLKLVNKVLPLGIPERAEETTVDTKETTQTLREIARASIVLLKNERNVLPFDKYKSIAVIGPNAKIAAYCGGGSASLRPYYTVTPYDGIAAQAENVKYAVGCSGHKKVHLLGRLTRTEDGQRGMAMRVYLEPTTDLDRKPIDTVYVDHTDMFLMDYRHLKLTSTTWYTETEGLLTPEESGDYVFSLSVAGTATLYVDGKLVVDNETNQTPGDSFFGSGTGERTGIINLEAGRTYTILVKHGTLPTSSLRTPASATMGAGGLRIGGMKKIDDETEIQKAVDLAKTVDQVVLCVGLNSDWESEGYDRSTMSLPNANHTTDLITRICATNPNTTVLLQSGTPVTLTPWLSSCPALLQAWYGGNETGNAIADILFGSSNPSGKLPLTFPLRLEDNPAYVNSRSERGKVVYGEGVYVGYRWYEKTKTGVAFPFGHGLSYTTFEMGDLAVSSSSSPDKPSSSDADADEEIVVSLTLTNTGPLPGAQVIQLYICPPQPPQSSISRPIKELKAFTKRHLQPGETRRVQVGLSKKYAASFWDEERAMWCLEKGGYEVCVGGSSAEAGCEEGESEGEGLKESKEETEGGKGGKKGLRGVFFSVDQTRWWSGL